MMRTHSHHFWTLFRKSAMKNEFHKKEIQDNLTQLLMVIDKLESEFPFKSQPEFLSPI